MSQHAPHSTLVAAAQRVLRANDRGSTTVAAPALYPHQWSWDAAFVSVGWATFSVPRALTELRSLLTGQWRTGMIPHIVFSPADGYFPGPDRWRSWVADAAPEHVATSGICQPPVHGWAIHAIGEIARHRGGADLAAFDAFVEETFDRWLAWQRWLSGARGTDPSGLIAIHHGWESGMDNSPRWDLPYARIGRVHPRPYHRQDLAHVDDPGERPSDADYDRYVHLVDQLVELRYDDRETAHRTDFRVGDVFVTALHALSAELLAGIAERSGRTGEAAELLVQAQRSRAAVLATTDPATGLARDRDLRRGEWLPSRTLGGLAPLVCGADADRLSALVGELTGPAFCGNPRLAAPVLPSTSPLSPALVPASYWRGPSWPVVSWLFSWCLQRHGHPAAAAALREAGLRQLGDLAFGEYYHPFDGRPLGSRDQSWTAAAALGWTCPELTRATTSVAGPVAS